MKVLRPTSNLKKTGVVTAHWRRHHVRTHLSSDKVRRAYNWLYVHNSTYRQFADTHSRLLLQPNRKGSTKEGREGYKHQFLWMKL